MMPLINNLQDIKVLNHISNLNFSNHNIQTLFTTFTGTKIIDLLCHLPTNINERILRKEIKDCLGNKLSAIVVEVVSHDRSNKSYHITCSDGKNHMDLVFFNANINYLEKVAMNGVRIAVSGKVEINTTNGITYYQMVHPHHIGIPKSLDKWVGTEATYPLTNGITQRTIQAIIKNALNFIEPLDEWIKDEIKDKYNFPFWHEALKQIHLPKSLKDLSLSNRFRQRLIYDELLANQININLNTLRVEVNQAHALIGTKVLQNQLIDSLKFSLTNDQKKAFKEISEDMGKTNQMVRLLQGDVGCGKTLVAVLAILQAIESGYQAALLVPTEILANQHFANLSKMLKNFNLKVALLTGKEKVKNKKQTITELANGVINLVIGTHSLIQDQVVFSKLGLIIVDEQHRFGVEQRLALVQKGDNPHILSMTATPIPRSLMLAGYGDMNVSFIKEKPANRLPINTKVISLERIDEVIKAIERTIALNNKVYWVCPLIEESEKINVTAVTN
jgi:ATP-dependent DNA helicase RecG